MFLSARRALLACGAVLLVSCLHGCNSLEDNGTHLAYALEKGAGSREQEGIDGSSRSNLRLSRAARGVRACDRAGAQ